MPSLLSQPRWRLRTYLGACTLAIAASTVACGGSSPTQPSPSSPLPVPIPAVVYSTLNPADSRSTPQLYESTSQVTLPGQVTDGLHVMDDFIPLISASVRTVSWQGGYCDPRSRVPLALPAPVTRSFRIMFGDDVGGAPSYWRTSPLYVTDLPASQVREELTLAVLENRESGCYTRLPAPFAYYTYTATLPTPVPVIAGQRYWLMIRADIGNSELVWGWRGGSGGDGKSLLTLAGHFWPTDMAFSLSQ